MKAEQGKCTLKSILSPVVPDSDCKQFNTHSVTQGSGLRAEGFDCTYLDHVGSGSPEFLGDQEALDVEDELTLIGHVWRQLERHLHHIVTGRTSL